MTFTNIKENMKISGKWCHDERSVMIVRFLGTTPNTSSIESSLFSICQQLSYNLEYPMEDIPEDFVPLKNYFRMLLDVSKKQKTNGLHNNR